MKERNPPKENCNNDAIIHRDVNSDFTITITLKTTKTLPLIEYALSIIEETANRIK